MSGVLLGHLAVEGVRGHRVIRMHEAPGLPLGHPDDPRVGMPDVRDADAPGQVDKAVAIHVREQSAPASRTAAGNPNDSDRATYLSWRANTFPLSGPGISVTNLM